MTHWIWSKYRPVQMDNDPPALASFLEHTRQEGEAVAAEHGYTLDGDPEVTEHPTVWVEDWERCTEDGEPRPGLVSPEWAAALGLDPDALRRGPVYVVMKWRTTHV